MISSKRVIVQDAAYEARRRVALLVGADRNDEFPPLPPETIAADIQCLKEVFSSDHAGYRQVDTLMGEQATKQGILQGIERLASDLTPDDVFLFYFSGHGFREGDHSYLLPKDAKRRDLVETSIAMDEILSRIPPIYATIFIADACHQEGILDLGFAFPLEMPENVAGLTSSRPSELSYVFPELRNSLYTHYLLEGLRGSADPANRGRVTIFDLYRYVSRKVRDYALTKNVSQTPTLSFNGIEDFVVAGAPTPQESLDEEQRRTEAGEIRRQMISAAEKEEWLRTLEKWDRLLEIDPEANRGLSTAIEARRALDQLPIPSENEETSLLLSYPRIWPCRREDPPIHPNTLVVHPDVRKGDLLLQYEVSDNTTLIQCAYVAETNAFQALAQDGIVRSYTILESKIDLSYPPLTLKKLAAEMRNPKMLEIAGQWEQFEAWSGDLRSSGVWDDLRYQILKGHTHAAASLLTAELAPLAFGLSARPDDPELREAVTNLFEKYKKLVKQPRSQLSDRELDARQEEFWSQIRPSESSEQRAISAQVPRVSDREALPQKWGAERVPSVFADGFALLIGVNESKDPRLALPAVLNDVTALRDVLASPRYCAYPAEHVRMISGKKATRAAIMDGLGWLKQQVEAAPDVSNATALVYYSGYGGADTSTALPTTILAPYDFEREHSATSALPIYDFAQALADIRPKNLLVVLDCSHSGLMAEQITERIPKNQSFAILTSSHGDQQSYTRHDRSMSVFTYHLIEALLGQGQPAGSPYVLISDVMSYVYRKTPETVHAESGQLQEPEFRLTANFAIGLLQGGQGAPETQAAQQAADEHLEEVGATVEETPKTSAASLSANQRIWFVTADPQDSRDSRGYRWRERAFQSGKERWTEVTNPTGKHFMSLARKGDLILAYQSTPVQEIVGIGRVQADAEPHEDHWAVPLGDFVEIPKGVTLGDLKEIVPKLSHVQNPQSAFSPVSPGQWEWIRGQIVERCPDLASQLPLPASAEPVLMPDMLSDRMQAAAGSVFPVRLTLRNTGNVPFRKGERFKLALEWSGEDAQPGDEPAYRQAPSQVLPADLPPTTALDLPERSVTAPAEVGAYTIRWTWESQDWGEPLSFVGEPMTFQVVPVGPVVPAYLTRIDEVDMPATVRAGETLAASLSLRNAGANVWRAGDAFKIECRFEKPPDERSDSLWSSWERSINVDVRSDLDAPASALVSFSDLTLDTTGIAQGDYKIMWRVTSLSHPDMSAATETRALHIGPPRAHGLEIAGIAGIPEETDTGASLSPVLTLSNNGEIAWKASDPLRVTGEFEGSGGISLSKPRLAWDGSLASDTPVGETTSVSLPVLGVPAEPGKYRLHWSLAGPAWGVKASQTSDFRVILPPLPVDRITGADLKAGRSGCG